MSYYVYILYSDSLGKFYKGQTNNIEDRLNRHNLGQEDFTKSGVPWVLVWKTEKPTRSGAIKLESKLKNLSIVRLVEFVLKYEEGLCVDKGLLKEWFES